MMITTMMIIMTTAIPTPIPIQAAIGRSDDEEALSSANA
jgi:hypothetical protein